MTFLQFRQQFYPLGCFSIHQVYGSFPDFDRNNFHRWLQKGYLVRLRQGMYAFAEYKELVGMSFYVANKIYTPSYISLHTALAEYGLIPELIVQTTSVSTLKTNRFSNDFGVFSYKSIRPELFFGYEFRPMEDGKTIWFALAEKALLDLMYLYPFYNTEEEFVHLRLDEDSMEHILDRDLFYHFLKKFNSRALNLRAELLLKVYAL